jgi:peptide/nickel transport system substrate-binding protein
MKAQRAMNRQVSRTLASLVTLGALLVTGIGPVAVVHSQQRSLGKPQYGGTVTPGLFFAPACLDPLKFTVGYVQPIWNQVFDTLVSTDEHGRYRANLATKWSFSHGGKWITFSLRHGVRFSNGDPLDADAVKYTLEHDARWAPVGRFLGPITEVQVLDRYTVRLVLPAPSRLVLDGLNSSYLGILDPKVEEGQGDSACQAPVGSGPFKVAGVGPGYGTVTLVRNPLHTWNPSWVRNRGRAYLSSLVFTTIIDATTSVSELLAGDIDVSRVLGTELPRVQHQPGIKLHQFYENQEQYLGFNTAHPPFDKAAVRKAFAEAIDRKALIKVVFAGLGRPAYCVIPAVDPFYDKASMRYAPQFNPADAKKIFAANHITGPYTLLAYNIPAWPESAEFIQAELAQVGVKINVIVKPVPDAQAAYRQGDYDMLIQAFGGNDPYGNFHSSQLGLPGTYNFTFYRNDTLDRLITQSRDTVDRKEAAQRLIQLQRFMNENVVVDPLFSRLITMAARWRIHGWHLNLNQDLYPVFRDMYVSK